MNQIGPRGEEIYFEQEISDGETDRWTEERTEGQTDHWASAERGPYTCSTPDWTN